MYVELSTPQSLRTLPFRKDIHRVQSPTPDTAGLPELSVSTIASPGEGRGGEGRGVPAYLSTLGLAVGWVIRPVHVGLIITVIHLLHQYCMVNSHPPVSTTLTATSHKCPQRLTIPCPGDLYHQHQLHLGSCQPSESRKMGHTLVQKCQPIRLATG